MLRDDSIILIFEARHQFFFRATDTVRSAIMSLSVAGWHHYIEGRHVSSDVGQNDNEERLRYLKKRRQHYSGGGATSLLF